MQDYVTKTNGINTRLNATLQLPHLFDNAPKGQVTKVISSKISSFRKTQKQAKPCSIKLHWLNYTVNSIYRGIV